jgi:hypothetical protein
MGVQPVRKKGRKFKIEKIKSKERISQAETPKFEIILSSNQLNFGQSWTKFIKYY